MDYEIPRSTRRCHASGQPLAPGEVYFSVLLEEETGLVRRDFSADGWEGPPANAIGFWRSRMPESQAASSPQAVGVDAMLEAFGRDEDSEDPAAVRRRYMLALLLIRRKALKLHGVEGTDGAEYLLVRRPRSTVSIRVRDPGLTNAEIRDLEGRMGELLETVTRSD